MRKIHRINTLHAAREYLNKQNNIVCSDALVDFNNCILEKSDFWKWPATLDKHQSGYGGLAIHTARVCSIADVMTIDLQNVRRDLVFTACLWHDIAKMYSYSIEVDSQGNYTWTESQFFKTEGFARSYSEFRSAAKGPNLNEEDADFVAHLILSQGNCGYPVEPQCAEAWAVHSAVLMSRRFLA